MDRISEIRARCEAATPGPWKWDLRTTTQQCKLVTDHSGQYYVMDFARWGMQDACPRLQVYDKYEGPVTERGSHGMVRADKLAKSYPGQEHHRGFDDYIDHPDAAFIAHSRDDITYLLAEVERLRGEVGRLIDLAGDWKEAADQYHAERNQLQAESRWIPVEERLPESGEHVLLCCEIRPVGKRYVCDGYYAASKSIACNNPESAIDYDEKTDEYYLLEGWYEVIKNWDDFSSICVDDFVTHWWPLPKPPKGE